MDFFANDDKKAFNWIWSQIYEISESLFPLVKLRTEAVRGHLYKILKAYSTERVGTHHFSSLTGYAHGDQNREVIDRIFAKIFCCQKAAIRQQFVSGTHAISSSFFGLLRPGDTLLSVTGKPYETT